MQDDLKRKMDALFSKVNEVSGGELSPQSDEVTLTELTERQTAYLRLMQIKYKTLNRKHGQDHIGGVYYVVMDDEISGLCCQDGIAPAIERLADVHRRCWHRLNRLDKQPSLYEMLYDRLHAAGRRLEVVQEELETLALIPLQEEEK